MAGKEVFVPATLCFNAVVGYGFITLNVTVVPQWVALLIYAPLAILTCGYIWRGRAAA